MARESKLQLLPSDAASVIFHPYRTLATLGHGDRNAARTCINCVLDEFLHRRGGSFDYLPGRNAVDRGVFQASNCRQRATYLGVSGIHNTICSSTLRSGP